MIYFFQCLRDGSLVQSMWNRKTSRWLNLLRHSLWGCSSLVKSLVYKSSIRPVLEYAAQVWNPHTTKNITAIESVQRRAARWAAGSQWNPHLKSWTKSSADCMSSLKWPTLETRRIYLCVAFFYDILHKRYYWLHCVLTPLINLSPPAQGSILFVLFHYRPQLTHIGIPSLSILRLFVILYHIVYTIHYQGRVLL